MNAAYITQCCVLCGLLSSLPRVWRGPFWLETAIEFCPGRVQGSSGRAPEMKRQKCGKEEVAIRMLSTAVGNPGSSVWFLKTWLLCDAELLCNFWPCDFSLSASF